MREFLDIPGAQVQGGLRGPPFPCLYQGGPGGANCSPKMAILVLNSGPWVQKVPLGAIKVPKNALFRIKKNMHFLKNASLLFGPSSAAD